MTITIAGTVYPSLARLSFAPRVDLSGTSLPIDAFEADIHTAGAFSPGQGAALHDGRGNLWAAYRITRAQRLDAHTVRIRAASDVAMLDRVTLEPAFYHSAAAKDVLDETIVNADDAVPGLYAPWPYHIDDALKDIPVTGYCPRQSARERLMWVCFAIGGCVKTCFGAHIAVLPAGAAAALIPAADIYWKPAVTRRDPVTAIELTAYTFTPGTPAAGDRWVAVGANQYTVTEQAITLSNPDAPTGTPENVVRIDGVTLVNPSNASGILTRLARWTFNRVEVEAEVIDDAAYAPGDRVILQVDEGRMASGTVDRAAFAFGLRSKARLHLMAAEDVAAAALSVVFRCGAARLGHRDYTLPVGYAYSIANPFLDQTAQGRRRVYRPENAAAEGTMAAGSNVNHQDYTLALDLWDGVLHVLDVDGITTQNATGVIA